LDNLHADFYDGEGEGEGEGDVGTRGGRITGIYNENTGNVISIDGGHDDDDQDDSDDDSDDDSENNDLYFWEDYDGERGNAVDDDYHDEASETDDNMTTRELVRIG
jgi:hypothetical protein